MREYFVHLPSSYDGKHATPLLLAFHRATKDAGYFQKESNLNNISEKRGFIVVYPNGVDHSWAAGGNFPADVKGVDDVAFVSALIDKMARELNIDTSKVYAAGFSNGGALSLRLACELSDKIAGIATYGSVLAENVSATCNPKKLIPILIMAGTADQDVPYPAGFGPGWRSYPDTVQKWVGVNGCPTSPVVSYAPHKDNSSLKVREEVYSPCKDNTKVAFYLVEGLDHEWPLAGISDIEGGEAVWDFIEGAA
jgi:polyhydroxybutyrate depolymerase